MVAILEKIILEIQDDRFIETKNPFNEIGHDYICKNTYEFGKGKIYGIICEYGGGGEGISLLLSGIIPSNKEKIYIDGMEADTSDIKEIGWYLGNILYSEGIIKKEISTKKALEYAIKRYNRYSNINNVIEEFNLTSDKLDYGFSRNCEWEMWRASLAVGYASEKLVYCFPWMNTLYFYDCLYNSSVFRFFNRLKNEGGIIILPTSRKENVSAFVDEIIEIDSPRFNKIISNSSYFKENF